ncbi:hypothetical protein IJI72_00110 [Candidatus Saccharibacteria bacterium]|nr:hypothetical protein [Candidatus Saccharibacteria bacterium]
MFEKSSTFQIPKQFLAPAPHNPAPHLPGSLFAPALETAATALAPRILLSEDQRVFEELNAIAEEIDRCRAAAR